MADFTINVGDTSPPLIATLQPAPGQSFTLVGATVAFRMWSKGQSGNKVDFAPCTVVDAVARVVKYDWVTGDADTPGGYQGEFRVVFPDGRVETFPNAKRLIIRVSP